MHHILNTTNTLLAPPLSDDAAQSRMRHYIGVILSSTAVLMTLLFFTNNDTSTRIVTAILLPYSVIGFALSYRGHIAFLRITIPFVFWLVGSALIYTGLGLHSVSVPALPLVVLIAALLGGRYASLLYTALSMITLGGVWFAEQQGLISNGMNRAGNLTELINLYMILTFVFVALWALISHMKSDRDSAIAQEKRYRLLADNIQDFIWTTDLSIRYTYASPSCESLLGYTSEEMQGMLISEILEPESLEIIMSVYQDEMNLEEKGQSDAPYRSFEIQMRCKDGSTKWAEIRVSFLRNEKGEVIGTVGVTQDISARRAAEEEKLELSSQLNQAQKIDSIGHFAGGIAHDFNNILVAIQGYSDMALRDPNLSAENREFMTEIQEAADRAAGLTRQLLTFGRRQVVEKTPVDLNKIYLGIEGMLRRLFPSNITLELDFDSDLHIVEGDTGQIEQMIMNLALNSRDAMEDGGQLCIGTKNIVLDQSFCQDNNWARPGNFVRIRISDNGSGMTPETLEHVFEPFYTTKEAGKGTGLGMSVVHGIVNQHKGFMHIDSTVPGGTTVDVYISSIDAAHTIAPERTQSGIVGGTETILLVEDNIHVQHLATQVLGRAGYNVLVGSNGKEGFALYEEHRDSISLVLTDIVMPELGGYQLMQLIHRLDPAMSVMLTSGYSAEKDLADQVAAGEVKLLQKPYRPASLLHVVREELDAAINKLGQPLQR